MSETTRIEIMLLALEYGYKACERGWNIEKTKYEFLKMFEEQDNDTK